MQSNQKPKYFNRLVNSFVVSDVDTEEENDMANCSSSDVSDIDINVDQIAGNDSSEFNKAMLKGVPGPYNTKKQIIFEVEEYVDCNENVANNSKLEDYNSVFKLKDNFLTSTVDESDDFLTIGLKISSSVENIQKSLNELIEMVRAISHKQKPRHDEDVTYHQGKS